MSGLRIAYVCADPGVPVFGRKGCSIHVQEVVRAFVRMGHTVTLFARRWGGEVPADLAGVQCIALNGTQRVTSAERERDLAIANRALPNQLEAHGRFDIVYERYALWSSAAMQWARRRGIASVLEVNAPLVEEQASHRELHDRGLAEAISLEALIAARQVVAVSSGMSQWLVEQGVDPGKIDVIANGVDVARFSPDFSTHEADPVIGFVGTLKPWHGLSVLVEASRLLRLRGDRFRLLLVGDGPERAAIVHDLAAAGLSDRSELTGAVNPEDIPALLARMDIAVAPYPALDGFYFSPLKVMEYMAAGKAVVASCIGDIDGLVDHGVSGCLCPPGDAAALANTLAALIGNPDQRTHLGRAARVKAQRTMGWDAVASRVLALAAERVGC